MSIWNSPQWRDVHTVKDGINRIIGAVPEWFIYLRTDRRFKCPTCYDESAGEPSGFCTECYGMGYRTIPYIVPGRLVFRGQSEGEEHTDIGLLDDSREIWNTIREVHPKVLDTLLQVSWNIDSRKIADNPNRRPVEIFKVYTINKVVRPYQNEVSWYKTVLTAESPQEDFFNGILDSLPQMEIIKP